MFKNDVQKTAVTTSFGLFEFVRMPFGLCNSGRTFQRYIYRALGDQEFIFTYVDDILIASANPEEHEKHLRVVLQRLREFHLRINVEKCQFGQTKLESLEYAINSERCKSLPEKVQAVAQFARPRTAIELRRFLSMVNFYRRHIPSAAATQAPLNEILRDSKKKKK